MEEDNTNLPGLPLTKGNWKQIDGANSSQGDGAKLFIQRGSKMNTETFDNPDDEPPF